MTCWDKGEDYYTARFMLALKLIYGLCYLSKIYIVLFFVLTRWTGYSQNEKKTHLSVSLGGYKCGTMFFFGHWFNLIQTNPWTASCCFLAFMLHNILHVTKLVSCDDDDSFFYFSGTKRHLLFQSFTPKRGWCFPHFTVFWIIKNYMIYYKYIFTSKLSFFHDYNNVIQATILKYSS